MLRINEIFLSIQGESSRVGKPCVLVRLQGCNLRCEWCDTQYARKKNSSDSMELTTEEIVERIKDYEVKYITITGGEPLWQDQDLRELIDILIDEEFLVSIETNGSLSLEGLPEKLIKVIDIKCPSSKMSKKNKFDNLQYLTKNDEIKFVVANNEDLDFVEYIYAEYKLSDYVDEIILSPVEDQINPQFVAEWLLNKKFPMRLQMQLHKIIWPDIHKGV